MKHLSLLLLSLFTIVGLSTNVCAMDNKRKCVFESTGEERASKRQRHNTPSPNTPQEVGVVQQGPNKLADVFAIESIKENFMKKQSGPTEITMPSSFDLGRNFVNVKNIFFKLVDCYVEKNKLDCAADAEVWAYNFFTQKILWRCEGDKKIFTVGSVKGPSKRSFTRKTVKPKRSNGLKFRDGLPR